MLFSGEIGLGELIPGLGNKGSASAASGFGGVVSGVKKRAVSEFGSGAAGPGLGMDMSVSRPRSGSG